MEPLRVNSRLVIPPGELKVSFARSSGPGGQKVNKTASQVQLRFSVPESACLGERRRELLLRALKGRLTDAGELLIRAQRHREQARNLEDARQRLGEALREALKPKKARKATKPTRASQERRMEAKRQRGRRKQERGGRFEP
ncbi:MAG: aminoacyl-tRNA hydrolase [Planctomycetes bacterium]|nr:aminoacyl-tRNA hydrolase [Planctomycetota bacterium]